MQRKNYLLKNRGGFAMIMAIGVIIIISTIMAISISMTAQTTKRTTDLYLYEQAVLLSKSAAEYALLRISKDNNSTNPCHITNLNFTQESIYDINISVRYIYTNLCTNNSDSYATIQTPEQNGSALMDITVSVPASKNVSTEPIRYFRRTIQKL